MRHSAWVSVKILIVYHKAFFAECRYAERRVAKTYGARSRKFEIFRFAVTENAIV
jgi:hypothetical protein